MKAIANYLIDAEPLGKGQFGTVHRCYMKDDHKQNFAVKIIEKKSLTPRLFNNLKNEINILAKINNQNVIRLHDIQRTENRFYLIMELCNAGDIENLKDLRGGRFTELEARIILRQLVSGFKEIYKQQVMHRDLKLANLLLNLPEYPYDLGIKGTTKAQRKLATDELLKSLDITVPGRIQVKIADLGFARELNYEDLSETMCGTPLVMAPEVLNGKRYNHKADVWSLGIVFFEMLVGFTPFTGRDKPDLKRNLERGQYGLPKNIKLSLEGLDFLNGCLQFEQDKRLSWNELVNHPYIKSDPIEEMQNKQGEDSVLHLSYSEAHGQYILDELIKAPMPQTKLNDRNAILLNCKDGKQFQQVYEKTIKKHFGDQVNQNPVLEIPEPATIQQEVPKKPKEVEKKEAVVGHIQTKVEPKPAVLKQDSPPQQASLLPKQEKSVKPVDAPKQEASPSLVLDTKASIISPPSQDKDAFKNKLIEIQKRQEEEAKKDPIAELDKKPLIIGDEVMRFSTSKKPVVQVEEEKKEGGHFNFELVNGDNLTPPDQAEKAASRGGSDGDLVDLAKDSFYTSSHQQQDDYKLNETQGFWEMKMLDPLASVVIITRDEYSHALDMSQVQQELSAEIKFVSGSLNVKDNYFV